MDAFWISSGMAPRLPPFAYAACKEQMDYIHLTSRVRLVSPPLFYYFSVPRLNENALSAR
eukprot:6200357-Pleurochrysis_carterae.AAC.5